jgi:F-type H+-transporting ATPase subunit alpha
MSFGVVLAFIDGIAHIIGLDFVKIGELVTFPHGVKGMILNLNRLLCSAVIYGDVEVNSRCKRTYKIMNVPVGSFCLTDS